MLITRGDNMIYYTKDNGYVNYNCDVDSKMCGEQANVYRLVDNPSICLKEYLDDCYIKPRFRECNKHFDNEMFCYFRDEFNHSNFCKLYDLLYDENMSNIVGYTMRYYKKMIDNILDVPIDYLLDNYSLLYDSVGVLADNYIEIVDLHGYNIINTDDGMIIIDYDQYSKCDDNEMLEFMNREMLVYTFYHMIKIAFREKGMDIDIDLYLKYKLKRLFGLDSSFCQELSPLSLKRKMSGCFRVIDYFYNF